MGHTASSKTVVQSELKKDVPDGSTINPVEGVSYVCKEWIKGNYKLRIGFNRMSSERGTGSPPRVTLNVIKIIKYNNYVLKNDEHWNTGNPAFDHRDSSVKTDLVQWPDNDRKLTNQFIDIIKSANDSNKKSLTKGECLTIAAFFGFNTSDLLDDIEAVLTIK